MIASRDELRVTQEQLARLECALGSLRDTVLPKNEHNYHIMAEAYIDQIRILREDINAYLGLAPYDHRIELRGTIREVNLDRQTFILGRMPHGPDLECSYAKDLERDVRKNLDDEVILRGVLMTNRRNGQQTMDVESIALAVVVPVERERKAG